MKTFRISSFPKGSKDLKGSRGDYRARTRARATEANGPEGLLEPFDPFTPFDRQRRSRPAVYPRLRLTLDAGFDPHGLGVDLWGQLAKTNR
jgi:hypothetical protein